MEKFKFIDKEGKEIVYYKWDCESENPRVVVQISHGMTETALRYDYFARKLNDAGYIVYAHNHRGHGETAQGKENLGYIADNDVFT